MCLGKRTGHTILVISLIGGFIGDFLAYGVAKTSSLENAVFLVQGQQQLEKRISGPELNSG